jgi:hypothetical protein
MTPAAALLADLRSRGVEFDTDGARLRWRPGSLVRAAETSQVQDCKAELIALLRGPDRLGRCPSCHRPLDSRRRCPKCFDRLCVDCGRLTGSYLIQRCVMCGQAYREEPQEPDPSVDGKPVCPV